MEFLKTDLVITKNYVTIPRGRSLFTLDELEDVFACSAETIRRAANRILGLPKTMGNRRESLLSAREVVTLARYCTVPIRVVELGVAIRRPVFSRHGVVVGKTYGDWGSDDAEDFRAIRGKKQREDARALGIKAGRISGTIRRLRRFGKKPKSLLDVSEEAAQDPVPVLLTVPDKASDPVPDKASSHPSAAVPTVQSLLADQSLIRAELRDRKAQALARWVEMRADLDGLSAQMRDLGKQMLYLRMLLEAFVLAVEGKAETIIARVQHDLDTAALPKSADNQAPAPGPVVETKGVH